MPRNHLLAQIDDELLQAQESLKFWRNQILLLDDSQFQVAAKRQIMHREAEIKRLLETHEQLQAIDRAERDPTASAPAERPTESR